MNSLFINAGVLKWLKRFVLKTKRSVKSSRAFESFRRRGIIEKPSRGDTVFTNSLILYGPVANRQLRRAVNPFSSEVGGSAPPWPTNIGANVPRRRGGLQNHLGGFDS